MHIDISAGGDVPCWVYSNENVSGQSNTECLYENDLCENDLF